MARTLVIRDKVTGPWIKNFSAMGWRVRNDSNSGWIQMHPGNSKIRNENNSAWENVK
jgi:hypothetical protein